MKQNLKYLWVYSAAHERAVQWNEKIIKARQEAGYDIKGFCCTPMYLNNRNWLPFPELDRLWKIGYPPLIKMYEELTSSLEGRDVLIHYNGANLHPEFIDSLRIFKVYTAADDPESTEILTKPVAKHYDLHLINNIACLDMYREWGCKNVYFWPLGSLKFPHEINLTREDIYNISARNNRLAYVGAYNHMKKKFFDAILDQYPIAECWGNGWANGRISDEKMYDLYMKTQIGFNVHNSTGPINFRLYELPAHGVLQLCDNKENLGYIFELDEEVIGFNTIDECLEKIDYYLSNKKEQRDIAYAGWERWKKDYTPMAVWDKLKDKIEENYMYSGKEKYGDTYKMLNEQKKKYMVGWVKNEAVLIKRKLYTMGILK